jgi:hypothetical protein
MNQHARAIVDQYEKFGRPLGSPAGRTSWKGNEKTPIGTGVNFAKPLGGFSGVMIERTDFKVCHTRPVLIDYTAIYFKALLITAGHAGYLIRVKVPAPEITPVPVKSLGLVIDPRVGRIALDRLDTVKRRRLGGVGLGRAQRLVIASLKGPVKAAALGVKKLKHVKFLPVTIQNDRCIVRYTSLGFVSMLLACSPKKLPKRASDRTL